MGRIRVVIRIEGTFDASVARALRAVLSRSPSHVTLDFSRARHVEDSSLAVLAGMIGTSSGRAVKIVGLGYHPARLLRYLGAQV